MSQLQPAATIRRLRSRHGVKAAPETTAGPAAAPLGWPLVALVAGWAVMVWPWLSGRVTVPWDAKAQFLPQIQFLAQSLSRGESPFWAPFVFSGQNQIADPQSMIFSPPFLALALLNGNPSAWAVDITVVVAQLMGAACLMVWFRDRGWHWAGGLVAGLVFAFGGSMAWRLQHTGQVLSLAYWPMAMLMLDRTLAAAPFRKALGYAVLLGLIAASIMLGRDQVALLELYLLAAYGVVRVSTASSDPAGLASRVAAAVPRFGLAALVALTVAGVPILLTALLAADSNRPSIDLEGAGAGSLHPAQFITAIIPQLYGAAFRMADYWGPPSYPWGKTGLFVAQNMGEIYLGLLPLMVIGLAALRRQLWAPEIRFFVVALAVVVLYALGWYTPFFHLVYAAVPGVAFYRRPADATFLIGALGAVLAGYATHRLFERPWAHVTLREGQVAAVCALAVSLLALAFAVRTDRVAMLPYPLIAAAASATLAVLALAAALPRMALEPWAAGLILATATTLDLAWNNGPSSSSGLAPVAYDEFDPATRDPVIALLKDRVAADVSPTRRDRVELLGLGFDWPNASLTHRLENTLGYNPVRTRLYRDATGAGDTIGAPGDRVFTPLLPSYRSRLVDLLGLRYVAAGAPLETIDPRLKPGDWTLIAQFPGHPGPQFAGDFGGAWVYENPRALPRVLFATRALKVDFDVLLRTGEWPNFDPEDTVLLSPDANAAIPSADSDARPPVPSVAITRYLNTEVEIEAASPTGGFVVLNDVWQPWWFVDVDGQPAPMLRANVLFRAAAVPAGRHRVTFRFRPVSGAWRELVGDWSKGKLP